MVGTYSLYNNDQNPPPAPPNPAEARGAAVAHINELAINERPKPRSGLSQPGLGGGCGKMTSSSSVLVE
ncbi:hypothetical protein CYMTET_53291 [Cymbomonas tetramitiformis]|uniref:Uncharacterized protein n=1 Tax=Cymbomonas tetramitiformis TaxID=36881 RepID=A0AAE0BJ27_9CHLO|nr:hypothetical protein CYMTET_53291 [Cymbomonas tetramitiformis]